MRARGHASPRVGDASDRAQAVRKKGVGGLLDPRGHAALRRTAVRRVVLEPAVLRRVVRRCDDDPVRLPGCSTTVVSKDGVGDDGGRGVAVIAVDHDLDAVGGEYLESADKGRLGQRVRVHSHEQRTGDLVRLAIQADRLRDSENVRLVEGARERRTAVSGRPEGDSFSDDGRVWLIRVVRGHQLRDVDQHRGGSRLAGERTDAHDPKITRM